MDNQMGPIYCLPAEIIQYIASLLHSDTDLLSLALTCHWLKENVLSPISGVWRRRFEDEYDATAWNYPSFLLRIEYQTRALVLTQRVIPAQTDREYLWLEVIQTLLVEAYAPSKRDVLPATSKNLLKVAEVVRQSDFLKRPMVFDPSDLFCAVQLCLTHLCLDGPHQSRSLLPDNYDIAQVYSYGLPVHEPLVQMGKVRLETLLYIRNFWQRHLMYNWEWEQSFAPLYLNANPKPKEWNRPLEKIEIPSGCWHGFYSSIHHYPATVERLREYQTSADHEAFKMFLVMETCDEPLNWSNILNETFPRGDESQRRIFFKGTQGYFIPNTVFYHIRGFFEEIREPQGRIPGWVRICYVGYIRYFHDDDATGESEDEEQIPDLVDDFESVHGFEGVVLPGGKIMVGQYFEMQNDGDEEEGPERGPCIYWEDSREKGLVDILNGELF